MKKVLGSNNAAKLYTLEMKVNEKDLLLEELNKEILEIKEEFEGKFKEKDLQYELLKNYYMRNSLSNTKENSLLEKRKKFGKENLEEFRTPRLDSSH